MASILRSAGYKTGLFTSPHLINVNERIRINGQSISNKEIETYDDLLAHLNLSDAETVEITETWSEILVRFLTNPMVAPLFMSLGMLGLFMEIKYTGKRENKGRY